MIFRPITKPRIEFIFGPLPSTFKGFLFLLGLLFFLSLLRRCYEGLLKFKDLQDIAALFTTARTWMSINRGMDKKDVVHYTMEYYSVIKKKEQNSAIYNDIGEPRDCHTE